MREEGVTFRCGVEIGADKEWTVERLRDEFEAVVGPYRSDA